MSSLPEIDIRSARERLHGRVVRTPLVPAPELSDQVGTDVYLKLESVQPTGSFKVRGATSKILSIPEEERSLGVVTASTGNHGRAVSYVARSLDIRATVCVSHGVPHGKLDALHAVGATVEVVGDSQTVALQRAHEIAEETGAAFVHPFDDPEVIAGQATIAAEVLEDLPEVASILVPLSGGGLLAGIATALHEASVATQPIGVSMERAAVMATSLEAGKPVDLEEEPTLADSLLGDIGLDNRYTFDIVSRLVQDVVLVDENAIWTAMWFLFDNHRLVVEGAGAVGVAGLLMGAVVPSAGPTVLVISGANAEPSHVQALLAGNPAPTM
ncbi:MAG: pyridoxal-phosphate dependent enzyme [Acidimicrobiia bacterium]|nr:pyridoxal-phosphate dependent enzyme [Acidimicrobiia bacterium]